MCSGPSGVVIPFGLAASAQAGVMVAPCYFAFSAQTRVLVDPGSVVASCPGRVEGCPLDGMQYLISNSFLNDALDLNDTWSKSPEPERHRTACVLTCLACNTIRGGGSKPPPHGKRFDTVHGQAAARRGYGSHRYGHGLGERPTHFTTLRTSKPHVEAASAGCRAKKLHPQTHDHPPRKDPRQTL